MILSTELTKNKLKTIEFHFYTTVKLFLNSRFLSIFQSYFLEPIFDLKYPKEITFFA